MKININTIIKNINKNFEQPIFYSTVKNIVIDNENIIKKQFFKIATIKNKINNLNVDIFFSDIETYKNIIATTKLPIEIKNKIILLKTIKFPIIAVSKIKLIKQYFNYDMLDIYNITDNNLIFSIMYELFELFKI